MWGPGEPSSTGDYAIISSAAGYKLMAADGLTARPYYCMADKPTCPDGYEWVSEFGIGTSCFKLVPASYEYQLNSQGGASKLFDLSVGEYNCLMDKTRLAVIDDEDSRTALKEWYTEKEPLMHPGEVD